MTKFERVEKLLEHMTVDQLLNELIDAMSYQEAHANLDHIVRMWDIEE